MAKTKNEASAIFKKMAKGWIEYDKVNSDGHKKGYKKELVVIEHWTKDKNGEWDEGDSLWTGYVVFGENNEAKTVVVKDH